LIVVFSILLRELSNDGFYKGINYVRRCHILMGLLMGFYAADFYGLSANHHDY